MKKVVLFQLLTYVVLVLCANCLTLLSPLSAISKVIILIWFNFASLSAALLVTLVLRATWPTTRKLAGLNRLQVLSQKEQEILRIAGKVTKNRKVTTDYEAFDEWEDLNERDQKNHTECNHKCRWEHGGKCCYCSAINPVTYR